MATVEPEPEANDAGFGVGSQSFCHPKPVQNKPCKKSQLHQQAPLLEPREDFPLAMIVVSASRTHTHTHFHLDASFRCLISMMCLSVG